MIIEDKLPNLDINTKSRIRSGALSIFRIDRENESFIEFIQNHTKLSETYFIVYSNDNTSSSVSFLEENGEIICADNVSVSKLVFLPLGFDIEYSYASESSVILKEYLNYSIPLFASK